MKNKLRQRKNDPYPQKLFGHFGEMGANRTNIKFIQTCLDIDELNKIDLVNSIPGSENWKIRELFQREIDEERVEKDLIPYFKNPTKVKYFFPLSIAVLPFNGPNIVKNIKEEDYKDEVDGREVRVIEAKNYYKITIDIHNLEDSSVAWNKSTKLVAVDGQHRLRAFKLMYEEWLLSPEKNEYKIMGFDQWKIPIILILVPMVQNAGQTLEKIRDIFVTINKKAEKPSTNRTILLDDFTISSICCQELLNYCHSGDKEIPLVFFDWRAQKEVKIPIVENEPCFLRVEELQQIIENYFFEGENGKDLLIDENIKPALNLYKNYKDDEDEIKREDIRESFNKKILPAIINILSNFEPIKQYVDLLDRKIEEYKKDESVTKSFVISEVVYGVPVRKEDKAMNKKIKDEIQEFLEPFRVFKNDDMPYVFSQLIGLRGVFSGFSLAIKVYEEVEKNKFSYKEFSNVYVENLNKAFKANLFDIGETEYLRHIAIDSNDQVANFRHEAQGRALGAYCAIVACAKEKDSLKNKLFKTQAMEKIIGRMRDTLERGFSAQIKSDVREKIAENDPRKALDNQYVKEQTEKEAYKRATKHLKYLSEAFEVQLING